MSVSETLSLMTKDEDIDFYIDTNGHKSQSCTALKEKNTVETIDKDAPVTVEAVDFTKMFLQKHKSDHYTVMKIDIEGAEYAVLQKMMKYGALSLVDELRIEFHGDKMDGDYTEIEQAVSDYCADNNVNLLVMYH